MTLFSMCYAMHSGGMGALSINLVHLPHPGGIMDQGAKLIKCFEIIKTETYQKHARDIKRGA